MANGRILWLTPRGGYTDKAKKALGQYLRTAGISAGQIFYYDIHSKVKPLWHLKKEGAKTMSINAEKKGEVDVLLAGLISNLKPSFIVCNDAASLYFVTNNQTSLDLTRGSVYRYSGLPVFPIDELSKTHTVKEGAWLLLNDLKKVKRWQDGNQRREPKFDYTVCHTLSDVNNNLLLLQSCIAVAEDIETSHGFITSVSFTGLFLDGSLRTYVIPFWNNFKPGNAHWESEDDEIFVWLAIRDFHSKPIPKFFQNGTYDNAYFARYNVPVWNWLGDSLHMFHSVWCELEKKLNFITSVCLDYGRYWKDENKGEKGSEVKIAFRTPDKLEQYWRYNALDTHYTMLCCVFLFRLIPTLRHPVSGRMWAVDNYVTEFECQVGPHFEMTMTGMLCDQDRRRTRVQHWESEHERHLAELKEMVDDEEFNPNSPQQFAQVLYDVFRATPIKSRGRNAKPERTVDEKILNLIRMQHPLLRIIIEKVWDTKKARGLVSNYGYPNGFDNLTYNNRFVYVINAGGTDTGRGSSTNHPYWKGRNAQNIQVDIRDFLIADEGYCIINADYSQSDAWFIAFNSQDPKFMETMLSDRDTHCIHAAHFFKKTYEEIYAGYKEKLAWVVHNLKGVRNLTKRIVHGSNFQMEAFTLYITMGREAVIASAVALGARILIGTVGNSKMKLLFIPGITHLPPDFVSTKASLHPEAWDQTQLVEMCGVFLADYHKMYTRIRPWFAETTRDTVKNGKLVTCDFGRTRLFFGDVANDNAIQRLVSAYYGQGGTAGNINRTQRGIYFRQHDRRRELGLIFLNQVHDSLVFMCPRRNIDAAATFILTVMQEKFIIKGREIFVPAELEVGKSWGDGLVKWKAGMDWEKVLAEKEEKIERKYANKAFEHV